MMFSGETHFSPPNTERKPACGATGDHVVVTTWLPEHVTCQRCQKTKAFKKFLRMRALQYLLMALREEFEALLEGALDLREEKQ